MKHTKKTLITTETSETLIVRQASPRQRAWCEACGAEVEMVSPEAAARSAGVGVRAVFRLIETGRVHFSEMPDGLPLVCLNTFAPIEAREEKEDV